MVFIPKESLATDADPISRKRRMSEAQKPRRRRPRSRRRSASSPQDLRPDPLIQKGYIDDLGDNLYHGEYNTKFLAKLHAKGADPESPEWRSAYRSFEGEVFEVFVYERLLRYVKTQNAVKHIITKQVPEKFDNKPRTALMLNRKGQIVYRSRFKDLSEFDALIFTDKRLYFVEMTLVPSVADLRRRIPKKRALLQLLFPHLDIRPMLVVSKGAAGLSTLPDYCSVWQSAGIDARPIFDWIVGNKQEKRTRLKNEDHEKMILPADLTVRTFKYYDTLVWVYHSLQGKDGNPMNLTFYRGAKFKRFHDLFTKVYIGTIAGQDFLKLYPEAPVTEAFVFVAIEREPLGGSFLTYFHFEGRKNLLNFRVKDGQVTVAKKDPMGITVTELTHLRRIVDEKNHMSVGQIKALETIIEQENLRESEEKSK